MNNKSQKTRRGLSMAVDDLLIESKVNVKLVMTARKSD